jgi:hypothetical protein
MGALQDSAPGSGALSVLLTLFSTWPAAHNHRASTSSCRRKEIPIRRDSCAACLTQRHPGPQS